MTLAVRLAVICAAIAVGCEMPSERAHRNMTRIDTCRRLCTATEESYEYRYESVSSSDLFGIPDGRCVCLYRVERGDGGAR